jgi:hypothetical protein
MRPLLLSLLFLLPAHAADQDQKTFGKALTLTEPVNLADAIAEPSLHKDKEILIEGKVFKVCKKKGCWMLLGDNEKNIRVTFKDYAFFVPKTSAEKRARAQGMIIEETLSVKAARHFLKDEGASKAEIKSIKDPIKTASFIASGVQFLD